MEAAAAAGGEVINAAEEVLSRWFPEEDIRIDRETFGRHPHRNEILGRSSTPEEQEYLRTETPPHMRKLTS